MRKKRYADAFKKQLIALVAQGRTPEQLAREYEPTAQTIRNWVNEAQKQQPASELEKDRLIKELKAENARLREEREILGKAALDSMGLCNISENASAGDLKPSVFLGL